MKNNKEATLKKWGELLDKMGLNDVSTTKINIARILESDASKLLKEEMEKNNIISDWIDKYGEPEIDKKVGMKLEEMNKERFNQIIDDVYENYKTVHKHIIRTEGNGNQLAIESLQKQLIYTQEQFINKIKTDSRFSEWWGLKIEERELSLEERVSIFNSKMISEGIRTQIATVGVDETYWKSSLEKTKHIIPTKLITLTYNNETIEVYE